MMRIGFRCLDANKSPLIMVFFYYSNLAIHDVRDAKHE